MEGGLKYKEAKIYPFSLKEYCSIEFPGYVKDINKVFNMLGGMESICQVITYYSFFLFFFFFFLILI